MTWETVPLGEVVDLVFGFAFDSSRFGDAGDMPLVRIRDVVTGKSKTYFTGDYDSRYVIEDGDLILGMDGEFNRGTWSGGPALLNQRVCKVTARTSRVDARYLYHALPRLLERIEAATSFVTVKHLSAKVLVTAPLPLPPLTEQRRIAAILDEADATVIRANAALTLVADAEDALFESTLGRTIRGTSRTLGDYSLEFRYGTSQKSGPSGAPVLRIPNLNGRTVDLNDLKTVDIGATERERLSLGDQDVLFVRSNGNPAVVGRAGAFASVPTDRRSGTVWVFASYLIRARLVAGVSTRGVVALTRSPIARRHLRAAAATSAGQFNISIPVLRSLPMFEPFGVQQEEFDNGMDELETLRSASSRREDSSQSLFASLQHRAFRGEL